MELSFGRDSKKLLYINIFFPLKPICLLEVYISVLTCTKFTSEGKIFQIDHSHENYWLVVNQYSSLQEITLELYLNAVLPFIGTLTG